jgi:ribosome maturation factor RimP
LKLHQVIEQNVVSLGYELVEIEFAAEGLLRITIDFADDSQGFVKIEDCEKVSRQLSYVLMAEDLDYSRLEVSSPGLDRPLTKAVDYQRFVGELVKIKLKKPVDGRRHFEGILVADENGALSLEWDEAERNKKNAATGAAKTSAQKALAAKAAKSKSNAKSKAPVQETNDLEGHAQAAQKLTSTAGKKPAVDNGYRSLSFEFNDVDKGNLVPQVQFNPSKEEQ